MVSFNKKKILVKRHYRERTGTAVGHRVRENESGKGGTTTCGSMFCFPDTLLKSIRERLSVVSSSLMVLLPRTLLECKKPQGHREDVLCTVPGVRSALNLTCVSPLSHCCWVLRLLRLCPLFFPFAHTCCTQERGCTDLDSQYKGGRTSHSSMKGVRL